jgi:hypothetical protein
MPSHRKGEPPQDNTGGPPKPHRHRLSWKKRLAWATGLAAAASLAFATGFSSAVGSHLAGLASAPASPGGPPVRVAYVGVQTYQPGALAFAFARRFLLSQAQLTALNAHDARDANYAADWLMRKGAIATNEISIQIVVRGNRLDPVQVVNITPTATCTQPLHGTLFYAPTAGANNVTQLLLNLDKPQQPLSYQEAFTVDGAQELRNIPDYFGHYTVSLKRDEPFTFDVMASTGLHYCRFTLRMTVAGEGNTRNEEINDNGKPFQITAANLSRPGKGTFSGYSALYVGGLAAASSNGNWRRSDPATYSP